MSTLLLILKSINSNPHYFYIIIRTILVYIYAIFLFRLGNRRFKFAATFDYILVIIIGAVLSRCINGPATLLDSMVGSFILIFLHWLLAIAAFHSSKLGKIVKGESLLLIKEGKIDWEVMRKNQITKEDLIAIYREEWNEHNFKNIKEAHLERNGKISFIKYPNK